MTTYTPPVDQLLTLGVPELSGERGNYLALGLSADNIPELLRMATDHALLWANEDSAAMYAPMHAWRALGQLRAEAAVAPLIGLWDDVGRDDGYDDWALEEIPYVLGTIGAPALPALTAYIADPTHDTNALTSAAVALSELAQRYPDQRAACVEVLTNVLARAAEYDPVVNGFVIAELIELHAVESAEMIKAAHYAKRVDLSIVGTWVMVKEALGLSAADEVAGPEPEDETLAPMEFMLDREVERQRQVTRDHKNKTGSGRVAKEKHEQEKKSRKANRKKKK